MILLNFWKKWYFWISEIVHHSFWILIHVGDLCLTTPAHVEIYTRAWTRTRHRERNERACPDTRAPVAATIALGYLFVFPCMFCRNWVSIHREKRIMSRGLKRDAFRVCVGGELQPHTLRDVAPGSCCGLAWHTNVSQSYTSANDSCFLTVYVRTDSGSKEPQNHQPRATQNRGACWERCMFLSMSSFNHVQTLSSPRPNGSSIFLRLSLDFP